MRKLIAAALGTACFIAAGAATAAPMTFFGEDLGLGEDTRLSSTPNSDVAHANFLSNLGNFGGVGTETFENLAVGTGLPLTLSFPGTGTATLTDRFSYADAAVAEVPSGTNGVGRYPISGTSTLKAVLTRHTLTFFAVLAFAYLLLPIVVVVVFSFNDPIGRFNFAWQGFTLNNWLHPFDYPGLSDAVRLSIEIALASSFFATIIGTLMAMALVRHQFFGQGATNLLIFLPMATPEIVMGSSLLTLFLNQGPFGILGFKLGFVTILIAHIMFNISFVVVTVRARLAGKDRHLEEAAADLYASPLTAFFKVTLPLIWPGILAGFLLAFALSVDDFVITDLVPGADQTFPLFVWGAARVAVPPQINVIGSAIFFFAVALMLANVLWQWRRQPKGAV